MSTKYFVEVLSRNKEVKHRQQIDGMPIHLGRAYDNDVILDDPHIAPHHAVIEQDAEGCIKILDQGSRNGIFYKGLHRSEMPIDTDTVFQLGYTYLRVRASDSPVNDEIAVPSFHRWEGWAPALVGLVLIALLSCFEMWKDDFEKFEASDYLILVVFMIVIGIIFCGIWAFSSRLFGDYARLGRHLFIFACGLVAIELWDYIGAFIAYALSLELFTRYTSHISIAIFSVMIFFHLQQIKPNRTRQFAIASIIFSFASSGIWLLLNYNSDKIFADELFMSARFPPTLRISSEKPVTKLLDDVAHLKSKVDTERTKAVSEEEAQE